MSDTHLFPSAVSQGAKADEASSDLRSFRFSLFEREMGRDSNRKSSERDMWNGALLKLVISYGRNRPKLREGDRRQGE